MTSDVEPVAAAPAQPPRRRRPRLVPRPFPAEPAPLSHEQTSLWFADRVAHREGMLNDPVAVRLRGVLDTAALRAAVRKVVDRHEVLRTVYEIVDGAPAQRVVTGGQVDFRMVDCSGIGEAECTARVLREASRGLDIGSGQVLRVVLFTLGADDHVLLLLLHHIVTDARSTAILVSELAALYGELTGGRPAELPALPVQYPDFACWQREWLDDERMGELVAHWRETLDGAPLVLALAADHPRQARRSSQGNVHVTELPAELAERLFSTARAEGSSPFMLGLAAFRALLWRLTGQHDLLIGSPLTSRMRAGTENLVGCFLSMLVLRGRLSDGSTVRELIAAERATTMDALAHHEVPFDQLVRELQPVRDGAPPLFQVTFSFETEQALPADLFGITTEAFEFGGTASHYDLMLKVVRQDDRVVCQWGYNDELYEERSVVEFAERYEQVLAAMTSDPGAELRALPSWRARPEPTRDELVELMATLVWEAEDEPRQPGTTSEELVADIWLRLLGSSGSAGQGFFELGGHSLSVAQLASRLEDEACVRIPVAELFERRTVTGQAELVDELLRELLRDVSDEDAERVLAQVT